MHWADRVLQPRRPARAWQHRGRRHPAGRGRHPRGPLGGPPSRRSARAPATHRRRGPRRRRMTAAAGPIRRSVARRWSWRRDLLVVGWYPAADDPITGRFVADQAAALTATGRVAPTVVSFEPLASAGDVPLRHPSRRGLAGGRPAVAETGRCARAGRRDRAAGQSRSPPRGDRRDHRGSRPPGPTRPSIVPAPWGPSWTLQNGPPLSLVHCPRGLSRGRRRGHDGHARAVSRSC